jgi:hypothetical protein
VALHQLEPACVAAEPNNPLGSLSTWGCPDISSVAKLIGLRVSDRDELSKEIEGALRSGNGPRIARFALACIGGAIPFAGGIVSGASGAWSEQGQSHYNRIFASWLKLQEDELKEIALTMAEILSRLNLNDENVRQRVESPEYLSLVKKCFRDWSAAESEQKRGFVRNLLLNAASHRLCSDDVVRMFIQWVDSYSEVHFSVIHYIYKNPGSSRKKIWLDIHGAMVRDDSAEADLSKLLIHDLSTGHVVRQHREKDYYGRYIKEPPKPRNPSPTLTSAFDDEKKYELTELGTQFVRYTMEGAMPSLGAERQM